MKKYVNGCNYSAPCQKKILDRVFRCFCNRSVPPREGGDKKILLIVFEVFFLLPPAGGVNGYSAGWEIAKFCCSLAVRSDFLLR